MLHQQFYLRELEMYQLIHARVPEILPSFELLAQIPLESDPYLQPVLLLTDSVALFEQAPAQLNQAQVKQRLLHSLQMLACLHQVGIVHGDLKPEHFRWQQGRGVLIDFEQSFIPGHIQSMGNHATPRYMAPELFHAEAKTMASDVYALGMIWYEWLTQQRIQKSSYLEWAKWHCQHFQIHLTETYEQWLPLLSKMLLKNKVQRLSEIAEIKQIFTKIV